MTSSGSPFTPFTGFDPSRRRLGRAVGGAALLGLGGAVSRPVAAATDTPLVVWFTVEGAKAMRRIGEAFTA